MRLPASTSADLLETGHIVVDGLASADVCTALRSELAALHKSGRLTPASIRLRTAGASLGLPVTSSRPVRRGEDSEGVVCAKAGVSELSPVLGGDLEQPDVLADCPALSRWWKGDTGGNGGVPELIGALNEAAPWLALTHLDTMKLQVNEGVGGCFPMHSDTTEATGRRVTAILYLTETWEEAHGGELRLFPFPLSPLDIAPTAGRMVFFSSVSTVHRVMPSVAPRYSIQLFLSTVAGRNPALQRFPASFPSWILPEQAESLLFLRTPANASALTKVFYKDEWAASIQDAFGTSPGVGVSLELHSKQTAALEAGISADLLALLRDSLPLKKPSLKADQGDGLPEEEKVDSDIEELDILACDDY